MDSGKSYLYSIGAMWGGLALVLGGLGWLAVLLMLGGILATGALMARDVLDILLGR
jgi:hypothetical protein